MPRQYHSGMEIDSSITRALKVLAIAALSIGLLMLFVEALRLLGTSGLVILASIVIAYLIAPIVGVLRRRMPMWAALLVTYVGFAAVVLVAFFAIVPPLFNEARSLISDLPAAFTYLQNEILNPKNPFVAKLPPAVIEQIKTLPSQINAFVAKYGFGVAQATIGGLFSVVTLFLSLIIVPVLSAYFFFDTAEIKRGFLGIVPRAARPRTAAILADLNTTLGAFVRGQALDGLILGALIAIMLAIMHVRYALLIGVACGILNLIPYVGALIGFVPAVVLALVFNGWQNAVIVAILFCVIQQLDGNVILPRVMKGSVQLSPLVIIIAILIGSAYFGVIGTFLAVPVAAILRVLKLHFAPAPTPAQLATDEKRVTALELL